MENNFGIYQLKNEDELHYHRFEGLKRLKNHGLQVEKKNYDLIYTAPLQKQKFLQNRWNICGKLYEKGNLKRKINADKGWLCLKYM